MKTVLKPRLLHMFQAHFIAFINKHISSPKAKIKKNVENIDIPAEFPLFQKFLLRFFSESSKNNFLSSDDCISILDALHNLYEAFRLNETHQNLYLKYLAELLANSNLIMERVDYVQYYKRDFIDLNIIKTESLIKKNTKTIHKPISKVILDFQNEARFLNSAESLSIKKPFDVYKWVCDTLKGVNTRNRVLKSAFFKPFELMRKVCVFIEIVAKSMKKVGFCKNRLENSFENSFNGSFSLPFKVCSSPKSPIIKGKNKNEFLVLSPIKFHVKSGVFVEEKNGKTFFWLMFLDMSVWNVTFLVFLNFFGKIF